MENFLSRFRLNTDFFWKGFFLKFNFLSKNPFLFLKFPHFFSTFLHIRFSDISRFFNLFFSRFLFYIENFNFPKYGAQIRRVRNAYQTHYKRGAKWKPVKKKTSKYLPCFFWTKKFQFFDIRPQFSETIVNCFNFL